jgi:hypothetical protein
VKQLVLVLKKGGILELGAVDYVKRLQKDLSATKVLRFRPVSQRVNAETTNRHRILLHCVKSNSRVPLIVCRVSP